MTMSRGSQVVAGSGRMSEAVAETISSVAEEVVEAVASAITRRDFRVSLCMRVFSIFCSGSVFYKCVSRVQSNNNSMCIKM
jgi:hypothetical protein